MLSLKVLNSIIRVSSAIGVVLSIYAYFVEITKEHDAKYNAMCDISEHMSCSKVFTSVYGRGFGILHHFVGKDSLLNQPNSVLGVTFYFLIIVLTFTDKLRFTKAMAFLNILSNIGSIYLASILYFVLYDFCIICVSTYIVNAVNLGISVMKLKEISRMISKPKSD